MTAPPPAATDVVEPAPKAVRQPLPASTALVTSVLLTVSALAVWGVLFLLVFGSLIEEHAQQLHFAKFRSQLAQATAPVGPTDFGKPVALLSIPSAGLRDVVVVEGTSSSELQDGPGHRRDTVLPGQVGTSVLYGKSVSFGGVFGRLRDLRSGDQIEATTGQGVFRYVVQGVRRPGDALPPALNQGQSRLTLATAEGAGWRNAVAPTSVVYVDALLQGSAKPTTSAIPSGVLKEEQPMAGRPDALLPVVLWLQALLVASLGAVWLRSRWGGWQAWIAGVPVVLAVAFFATATTTQLLPNLF